MIKSMTGFGRASTTFDKKKYQIEIRSLNSKQLDLNLRIPSLFRAKEHDIRTLLSASIQRGKADMSITSENGINNSTFQINKKLAKEYFEELKTLAKELGAKQDDLFARVLQMPEVMQNEKEEQKEISDEDWVIIKTSIAKCVKEFDGFRIKEGKSLETELKSRISEILSLLKSIEPLDKKRFVTQRAKLKNLLAENLKKGQADENRFEQELIFYFEKLDIAEEKLRLKTHCDYFLITMKEEGAGRKLNFISQEIGREINTIGSKANDAPIQKIVVQMKDELEKIKEQLMNVL